MAEEMCWMPANKTIKRIHLSSLYISHVYMYILNEFVKKGTSS